MKYKFFVLCFSLFLYLSVDSVAQSNFIPGSVTLKSGQVLEGRIDYQAWINNPESIRFKDPSSKSVVTYVPDQLAAFEVENDKYISAIVGIDQAPLRMQTLDLTAPLSITAHVFLKVIVSGKISLYQHKKGRVNFYIKYDDADILELISQKYVVEKDASFFVERSNEHKFRRQLEELDIGCPVDDLNYLSYTSSDLKKYIIQCNKTNSYDVLFVSEARKIRLINRFHVGGGIGTFSQFYSEFKFFKSNNDIPNFFTTEQNIDFKPAYQFGFGYSLQVKFPGNLSKNSVGISTHYSPHKYSSEKRLLNFFFQVPNQPGISEEEIVLNPTVEFSALAFQIWYARRILPGYPSPFLDVGLNFSKIYNYRGSATHIINQYSTSDVESMGFINSEPFNQFEETRDLNFVNTNFFNGAFLGIGYETSLFFSVLRAELLRGSNSQRFRLNPGLEFKQLSLLFIIGVKI